MWDICMFGVGVCMCACVHGGTKAHVCIDMCKNQSSPSPSFFFLRWASGLAKGPHGSSCLCASIPGYSLHPAFMRALRTRTRKGCRTDLQPVVNILIKSSRASRYQHSFLLLISQLSWTLWLMTFSEFWLVVCDEDFGLLSLVDSLGKAP